MGEITNDISIEVKLIKQYFVDTSVEKRRNSQLLPNAFYLRQKLLYEMCTYSVHIQRICGRRAIKMQNLWNNYNISL